MHLTTNAVRRPESTTAQIENETIALHPFPRFIYSRALSISTLQVRGRVQRFEPSLADLK